MCNSMYNTYKEALDSHLFVSQQTVQSEVERVLKALIVPKRKISLRFDKWYKYKTHPCTYTHDPMNNDS